MAAVRLSENLKLLLAGIMCALLILTGVCLSKWKRMHSIQSVQALDDSNRASLLMFLGVAHTVRYTSMTVSLVDDGRDAHLRVRLDGVASELLDESAAFSATASPEVLAEVSGMIRASTTGTRAWWTPADVTSSDRLGVSSSPDSGVVARLARRLGSADVVYMRWAGRSTSLPDSIRSSIKRSGSVPSKPFPSQGGTEYILEWRAVGG